MGPIIERFVEYITFKGYSDYKAEHDCGLPNGTIQQKRKKGGDIKGSTINKILLTYKEINSDWLIRGNGDMLLHVQPNNNAPAPAREDMLPLHENVAALAGVPSEDAAPSRYFSSYIVPDFKRQGATDLIRIHGNSMLPRYNSGDIVGVMQIFDPQFIEWGRVYVLDTTQGVLIKRLFPDKQNVDNYLCHSDNTEEYPDFSIPKTEIRKIFKVVGSIKLE